ncbi:MAG: Gfo/Idh/MocA family oxidoreductase [Kiritimatiellae bacterium]|nr:Gfo/Idh/MocA family oxidoreductase [Kiritimatiellia bacterium]
MIRLGVVGCGQRISGMIRHCFRKEAPDLRVVGIVDPDEEGARGRLEECDRADAVFYKTLAGMVKKAKLDALAIGTRCNLHASYAVQAARYDIPLFLEKPVAVSMQQAVALERAFERSKCRVVVSFPLRVTPLCRLAREYVEKGAVGSPQHVAAVNAVPYGTCYWEEGYRNYAVTQGLFLQKATHDFDYLMYLVGSPIVRVAAMAARGRVFGGKKKAGLVCSRCREADACPESPRNRRRNHSGGSLADHPCLFGRDCGTPETGMNEDSSSALIEFASGMHGTYWQVFFARRDAAARGARISGYHGTLEFDWYRNDLKHVRHHAPFTDTVKAGEGMSHFGGDSELAADFISVIRGKGEARTPIRTGIQSAYACLAAKQSAETGRFVNVRQVGG